MTARYLLCPGLVRSRDGLLHKIGPNTLAHLYGVKMADCLVLPTGGGLDESVTSRQLLARVAGGDLIALRPRDDGEYSLPEAAA